MWVCNCKAVTDHHIRELLESPFVNTVEDVGRACGAGTGCGGCRDDIARLCEEARVRGAVVSIRTDDRTMPRSTVRAAESGTVTSIAG